MPRTSLVSSSAHAGYWHCMPHTSPENAHATHHGTACHVHVWFHSVHMLGTGTACWVQVQKKHMPRTMALHATYKFGFIQCTCWVQALHATHKSRKCTCHAQALHATYKFSLIQCTCWVLALHATYWHCMPRTCTWHVHSDQTKTWHVH